MVHVGDIDFSWFVGPVPAEVSSWSPRGRPPSHCTDVVMNGGPTNRTEFEIIRDGVESEELTVVWLWNDIDEDDSVFIATALCFNASIWSEDKHFQKQKVIPVISTREMIENL